MQTLLRHYEKAWNLLTIRKVGIVNFFSIVKINKVAYCRIKQKFRRHDQYFSP
jgi:hypothetical protein